MSSKGEGVLFVGNIFAGIDVEAYICLEPKAVDELSRLCCTRVEAKLP